MSPRILHALTVCLNAVNAAQLAAPVIFGTSSHLAIVAGIVLGGLVSVIHVFLPAPPA